MLLRHVLPAVVLASLAIDCPVAVRTKNTAVASQAEEYTADSDDKDEKLDLYRRSPDVASTNAETYRVLSYNICWGCMEGDLGDGTGMKNDLKRTCMKRTAIAGTGGENGMGLPITECANTMGQQIKQYWDAIGGYDLMGFQEASNQGDLYLDMPGMKTVTFGLKLGKDYTHSKGDHKGGEKSTWIVSMYNEEKFGAHDVMINDTLESSYGRPYLVLLFDAAGLIFINVHNTHPPKGNKKSSWDAFPREIETRLDEAFRKEPKRKTYRVIMVGDFNDLNGQLPDWIEAPWLDGQKTMSLQRPPPRSCCTTKLGTKPKFYGDYIMDSATKARNRIPGLYNGSIAQSDHRPVEAILKADSQGQGSRLKEQSKGKRGANGSNSRGRGQKNSRRDADDSHTNSDSHKKPRKYSGTWPAEIFPTVEIDAPAGSGSSSPSIEGPGFFRSLFKKRTGQLDEVEDDARVYAVGADTTVHWVSIKGAREGWLWPTASATGITSIALAEGKIYGVGTDDTLYKQDISSLSPSSKWKEAGSLPFPCDSIAVFDGMIYVVKSKAKTVFKVKKDYVGMKDAWKKASKFGVESIAISDGTIYGVCVSGRGKNLKREICTQRLTNMTTSSSWSSASVAGNYSAVAANENIVYVLMDNGLWLQLTNEMTISSSWTKVSPTSIQFPDHDSTTRNYIVRQIAINPVSQNASKAANASVRASFAPSLGAETLAFN